MKLLRFSCPADRAFVAVMYGLVPGFFLYDDFVPGGLIDDCLIPGGRIDYGLVMADFIMMNDPDDNLLRMITRAFWMSD